MLGAMWPATDLIAFTGILSTLAAFPASSVYCALKTCSLETYWKEEYSLEEGIFGLLFQTDDKCAAEEGSTCSAIVVKWLFIVSAISMGFVRTLLLTISLSTLQGLRFPGRPCFRTFQKDLGSPLCSNKCFLK